MSNQGLFNMIFFYENNFFILGFTLLAFSLLLLVVNVYYNTIALFFFDNFFVTNSLSVKNKIAPYNYFKGYMHYNFIKLFFPIAGFILFISLGSFLFYYFAPYVRVLYFKDFFLDDFLAITFKLFISFVFFTLVFFSNSFKTRVKAFPEFSALFLIFFMFLLLLPNTFNFLSLYLILEGITITLFALLLIQFKSKIRLESTLKYFCLSTVTTAFFLIGIALVYLYTGHIGFFEINSMQDYQGNSANRTLYYFGITFLFGGLCFKLSLFPCHS
jgi:NADH:ubiquinone oxidoreductase subunit 2 (subunit N)